MVRNSTNRTGDNEICWWLGVATSRISNCFDVHCWKDARGMVKNVDAQGT